MLPDDPPEPSCWYLPFQLAAGGSQISKPIWESAVGVATPTMRQKGSETLVRPNVAPLALYSAVMTVTPEKTVLPASAWQLAASPLPAASAAITSPPPITDRAGNSPNTETKPSRRERDARFMENPPRPAVFGRGRRRDPLTGPQGRQAASSAAPQAFGQLVPMAASSLSSSVSISIVPSFPGFTPGPESRNML